MKSTLTLFVLLTLLLSACGTVPTPELGTGDDDIGAYTVVARNGDETLSAQGRTQRLPERVLEVREYSNSRYRAVFSITFSSYTKDGLLAATVGIGTGNGASNFNYRKLHGANPRTYSVASDLATLNVRRGTKICGYVDGRWGAMDEAGDYHYYDEADFESFACYHR